MFHSMIKNRNMIPIRKINNFPALKSKQLQKI